MLNTKKWDPSWVRQERVSKGLSVDSLAKRAELPNSTVSSVETEADCRLSNMRRVLRALGVTTKGLRRKYGGAA